MPVVNFGWSLDRTRFEFDRYAGIRITEGCDPDSTHPAGSAK